MGVGDIEEVVGEARRGGQRRPLSALVRGPKARPKAAAEEPADGEEDAPSGETSPGQPVPESRVPGRAKVYLRTWGCSHNASDSEYMGGLLREAGYDVGGERDGADVWLLNSCTVKTPSEAALAKEAGPSTPFLKGLSLVGVQQTHRVVEVVERSLQGLSVRLLASQRANGRRAPGPPLSLPKIRRNPLVEILAINTGCLNHCTYCKTKAARGDLVSYPVEELVERARESFAEGVKELWLTSEDLGAYGRDIGLTLPDLLNELVKEIPEGCRMRLGMTNPPYILDHLEEMAAVLRHPRVYKFLHIPVQAGSDAVLRDMRREYTRADFCRVMDFLRAEVPGIWLATDLICGFPTETKEDFQETMSLVDAYRFPSLFINQYFPRPGTPSARMKRVDTAEVKRRTKAVSALFASYSPYQGGVDHRSLITSPSWGHQSTRLDVAGNFTDHYIVIKSIFEKILPILRIPGKPRCVQPLSFNVEPDYEDQSIELNWMHKFALYVKTSKSIF